MITQISKQQERYLKLIALRPHVYEWSYTPLDQLLENGLILKYGIAKNFEIATTDKGKQYLKDINFNLPVTFTDPFFIFKQLLVKPLTYKQIATNIEIPITAVFSHINKWKNLFKVENGKVHLIQQTKEQYKSCIDQLQY